MKNCLHFETQEEKILELHQQNLDKLLKNELNHEEPPWRTPVTKEWWDRMKEKNKIKSCGDLDGGSDEMTEKIWTPEKKRWKHLELEFIHQEQTPKERITHFEENKNKIYCMLILHQIKLMTSNGFCI